IGGIRKHTPRTTARQWTGSDLAFQVQPPWSIPEKYKKTPERKFALGFLAHLFYLYSQDRETSLSMGPGRFGLK
ncbi:MAG: hypothetical protein KAR36_09475, partial [Candidatus Latescibacteria bacterium]|nr:hypothetical protein [Candidatus Latescibacterota bacterium]